MTLTNEVSPIFPLVVHQPASPSNWAAVQYLRRGSVHKSRGDYVGEVEDRMCVVYGHSDDGCNLASTLCRYNLRKGNLFALSWARVLRVSLWSISSELLMCGGGVRSILLLPLVGEMPRDNRCMYMAHVCFCVCCSDCVRVCGNVCCVAAVFKDSVF